MGHGLPVLSVARIIRWIVRSQKPGYILFIKMNRFNKRDSTNENS